MAEQSVDAHEQIIAWLLGEADQSKADLAAMAIERALNGAVNESAMTFEIDPDRVRGFGVLTDQKAHDLGAVGLAALGEAVFRTRLMPTVVVNRNPPARG